MAAKEEGITEVPCVFVDYLTEAQKKAYVLADNRMAWDEELLRMEMESFQGADFDVSCRASVMKGQGGYLSGFEV